MLVIYDTYYRPDPMKLLPIYEESILTNMAKKAGNSEYQNRVRAEDDFLLFIREEFYRVKGCRIFVWQHEGVMVSALRLEPYKDGYLLCGLETAPMHRRKGYAKALLLSTIEYLKINDNCIIYSHIHRNNRISLRLHSKCGFCRISDTAILLDGSVSVMYHTLMLK